MTALLRTAGLPVRLWVAAGSPELFALLRTLERAERDHAALGVALAEAIGREVVPSAELTVVERRLALAARRRLHRALPLTSGDHARLAELADRLASASAPRWTANGSDRPLAAALDRAGKLWQALEDLRASVARHHDGERERLAAAAYESLLRTPAGRNALRDGTIPVGAEVAERLAAGRTWADRGLRHRSDHLWRMIARGSAKVTPRSWLGHVALVHAGEAATPSGPLTLTGEFSTDWIENAHNTHTAPGGLPAPDARVSFAPLSHLTPTQVEVLALDPREDVVLTPVRIRRTPLIDALSHALKQGARPLAEVETALLPPQARPEERETLRHFVSRLAAMGVLQIRPPATRRSEPWRSTTSATPRVDGGYLDVYRRTTSTIPDLGTLRQAITGALRLHALTPTTHHDVPAHVHDDDRPVLDILRDQLAGLPHSPARRARDRRHGWPPPHGGAYERLLTWLNDQAAASTGPIDLSQTVLDTFGAPPRRTPWPLDAIVRPLPGHRWALDLIGPAAVLDARFVTTLERLNGPLPQADAYRAFLRHLTAATGVPSVEVLFPSLSRYAANAVRRPLYTTAWTGDPDLPAYCDGPPRSGTTCFLPLGDLTARREKDRVVVSHRGEPIRPLYHSVRNAPPPWDLLTALLLGSSPQTAAWRRRLRHPLAALPDRDHVPRLTAGPSLVLSAAQWRVPPALLPPPGAGELAKARRLIRLRDRLGLPRWIYVSTGPGAARPQPCDLESLYAARVLEQAAAQATTDGTDLVIEEMLPSPDELTVLDLADPGGSPVAAELMIRIPADGSDETSLPAIVQERR
ncbi:hypothetical protein FXF51_21770 [Nonomuraea sp. PA05]|uniref:lantibiotic dehydratase n=1 Tax=Nonomuraea sp. PA05 TaxID=2604466 RepID=UPI0011D93267|nr:lantibiotic dehydratase [Nonomuraea sp. PA05]TYB64348.1 hypothetical protein FXF51_21770 [Nonomuraea sp. PA05]